ncbi:MAG: FAD:protein FMN transferase [Bryobacteraceae bacterium]|jgi:thiamine biosynthesis lipoprotein|nr:FAD:protein FMN transferase [Bryobacteraceae bacterium]
MADNNLIRLERSLDAMGTTYTIAAYGTDRFAIDSALESAFEEAVRLDGLLSNYRADSEWSKVNREAASGPVQVSEELFALLERCQAYSKASEGAFDITVGPLMKIWGFYKQDGRIPHRAEIRQALSRIGWRNIVLDPAARTVKFTKPIEMDPGGIGKGYAVDRMIDVLKKQGIQRALISAGRSSIYGLGAPPSEPRGWRVLIPDPRDQRKTAAEVYLRNESMSTSGSSEKFFMAGGKVYSHIMDPRTGYPAQGILAVSVIAPKTIDSEAWTKPFFVLGRHWAARNRPRDFKVFLCEDRLETACAFLP